jgi:hypothetical protein
MQHILMTLFTAALFFILTPGILLSLPKGGSKYEMAVVHALVFAFLYHLTHKAFYAMVYGEGFEVPYNPMYYNCGAARSPTGISSENPPRGNCQ